MNVNIMTAGYWPTYPVVDARLPAELNEYQQANPPPPPPLCAHSPAELPPRSVPLLLSLPLPLRFWLQNGNEEVFCHTTGHGRPSTGHLACPYLSLADAAIPPIKEAP